MAEEWVDHAHSKLKKEEAYWVSTTKSLALAEKKNKDLVTKLIKVDRERKSSEAALAGAKKQAED